MFFMSLCKYINCIIDRGHSASKPGDPARIRVHRRPLQPGHGSPGNAASAPGARHVTVRAGGHVSGQCHTHV